MDCVARKRVQTPMTLTQYFIGAWVTAVLMLVWDFRETRSIKDRLPFFGEFLFVLVFTACWPAIWLIGVGLAIRKAVLR